MTDFDGKTLTTPRSAANAEGREIKKRGVLLGAVGYIMLLAALTVYRHAGIAEASWTSLGWLLLGTAVEVGVLWWIPHAGRDEALSWDPDYIYLPLVGAALVLGAYLVVVPEARDILLVAWFVALFFGAGLIGFRGVMYLGTLMMAMYLGAVGLHAAHGASIEPVKEITRVGLLVGVHGFSGLVFRRLRRSREEKRMLRKELEREAVTDPLTGLYNRRFLMERLHSEIGGLERYGGVCSVVMLDLDHYKQLNDAHGHAAGDEVLVRVARLCEEKAREADVVARYGGEEFAFVLPDTSWREAREMAGRLRGAIESTPFRGEEVLPEDRLTASLGIAGYPEHSDSADGLIRKADEALYGAKRAGRNGVRVADSRREASGQDAEGTGRYTVPSATGR